jgi:VIT1/CCC1 family predicted Fe2+/Mn2+ transporter
VAAGTSFLLFAVGAIVPVLPYLLTGWMAAVVASTAVSTIALFVLGAGTSLFTDRQPVASGSRQVFFRLSAAAVTFGLGKLVGMGLGV